jgi:hypothetical protein
MYTYSDQTREDETYALPNVEVFYLTAEEAVELDEDLMYEARKEFPLAGMNSRDRDKAIAWAVEESGATGGWYYWYCFPGCLPDSEPFGPYATEAEAVAAAQDNE